MTVPWSTERRTGFVHQSVVDVPGGFRWTQRPGPDRPAPHPAPAGALLALLPDRCGETLRFVVGGPRSLLAAAAGPGGAAVAHRALLATGATLAAVHAVPVASDVPAQPPAGPRRLLTWLGGAPGPGCAARLRDAAARRLGADRTAALPSWSRALLVRGPVLVHGNPGLGLVVPAAGPPALLCGDGPTAGDPALDLGWLLGELVELGRGGSRPWPGPLARALLTGHGSTWPTAATCRAAAVRMATHLHDYAAYVGWDDDLPARLDLLAELVDDPEAGVAATLFADRPLREPR